MGRRRWVIPAPAVAAVAAVASPAYAITKGLSPEDICVGELPVFELAKQRTMLSAPADGATVVVGSPVTFSAESGLNWPLTFEVASSPALLPSPDVDGGPGSVAPGTAIYTFASTKVTATPRTVYWAASFTRALNGCTGPPVTYTTPARALIVLPATSAPTPTPVSLTLLGQPSVGAKGASFNGDLPSPGWRKLRR